ncbi:MAG: multidrug efflux RND transporter permease subunit [Sphingomonas sp.]|uniref:multidrug efflux RND transporter permease subunit n=1 Tax=Sphingomonas sp. TaxID=28214 RepID=UPI0022729186|nr:multidrug efflux RND transporter permease subunit [Sphingomonas sp.]MCX8475347.1 multidrug efflux RND transporter permease subunit [Sphingomonas sp.]
MNRFFVYRPIFAWVIALLVILFGAIALRSLAVEQYPDVAPPSLSISASFSGADARTLDRTVTSVIEREMSGIDGYLYMSSTSRANGTASINVTFESGTDLDTARAQVQERISRVEPRLPEEVRQLGIRVTKSGAGFLMLIALNSKGGATSALEMGNFASNNIADELRRVPGVGDVQLFGSSFAMRIWLDREKLAGFGLSPGEVLAAVREQNSQTAGGGLGLQPVDGSTEFTAQIVTSDRFSTAQQFRDVIIRSTPGGSMVRLGDVARVSLGNENYGFRLTLNGAETAGMAVQIASGANALSTAAGVRARLHQLETSFPADIGWTTPFDTTPFITASVNSVLRTMVEAMILVSLVVFLFLQSWRTMFVPTLVVPIALLGACLGLLLFGASINLLSLFAMIVAIGILNDDAIVIVENVERIMRDEGLDPREATVKAMGQLTGAIVATTLVLLAVFAPMGFFPGSTGGIYRQFSLTIGISLVISTVLSLTLAPALCGMLLRPPSPAGSEAKPGPLGRFFAGFNGVLDRGTTKYLGAVAAMVVAPLRWALVFVLATLVTVVLFGRLPGGFLPSEDQGYVFVAYTAPPGATMARTQQVVDQAEAFLRKQPEVRNVVSVIGFSFFGQGQSAGMSFVDLKPWGERSGAAHSADALVQRSNAAFSRIPQGMVFALSPPPIQALGNATGFSMKIEDRGAAGSEALQQASMAMMAAAAQSKILAGVRPEGMPPAPQLSLQIDRIKARAMGLQIGQVNQALSIAFGSAYVNDFVHDGNILRVFLQADASQRMRPEDVAALRIRNDSGQMVPFSAFSTMRWTSGPQQLERYNGFPSATLSGQAAPGYSSGAALREMERIAREVLPRGFAYEWTGIAFEENQAGGQIGMLLGLSVVLVFLLLAALYESWSMPAVVLLIVPLGIIGAVLFTMARGMSADVYFNVGLITIIGLAAKNAILIVQFALEQEAEGRGPYAATMNAASQRLRPIVMTSLTFVIGMVPLVLATGAGAASRQAVGTGVMGSMLTVTAFGIFFTPFFYYSARRWISGKKDPEPEAPGHG